MVYMNAFTVDCCIIGIDRLLARIYSAALYIAIAPNLFLLFCLLATGHVVYARPVR